MTAPVICFRKIFCCLGAQYLRTSCSGLRYAILLRQQARKTAEGYIERYGPVALKTRDSLSCREECVNVWHSCARLPLTPTLSFSTRADFLPYGVRKNRAALESITRYGFEQGLTAQQSSFEEFFLPNLLDTCEASDLSLLRWLMNSPSNYSMRFSVHTGVNLELPVHAVSGRAPLCKPPPLRYRGCRHRSQRSQSAHRRPA